MVGGVGWGSAFSRVFSGFSCSGSANSPKAELKRRRRWESWRESGTAAGVKLSRCRLGLGRCRWAGVRRLCAEALKLCVMRSLHLLSLSPSLSPSVSAGRCRGCCSLETVGGWEDRDGWPVSAGLSPGRWAGVGVSGPVGGVLGASSPAGTSLPLRGAGRVVLLLGLCFSLLGWGWPVMPWAASAPAGR